MGIGNVDENSKRIMKSPCINICRYNDKYCVGCYRTSEEISNWTQLTNKERKRIMRELPKRRMEDGQDYYGHP